MGIALITNNILSDSGTAVAGLVPTSRTISTTAPLTGGGDLSADRTIAIPAATSAVNGYLTSADWTTFNAKQAAGDYITSLTGEATGVGPGATAVTLNNASVTGKVLTGVNITGGTVLATDTMLTAFGKLQNQINGLIGSTIYQGVWNASTNTPTLASGVGTNGYYYIVNVAGSTNLDGITDWKIGDWAIFNGGVWQKVDNTESVTSVNGFTGAVSLTTDNVGEGATNLYFSNARARSAISLTVTGASGASSYNNTTGVLNVPTYTLAGLGGQPLAANLTSLADLTFASTSFVKMTAAGTFALDTNVYLTTASAASTYLPLTGGTLTGVLRVDSALRIKSGAANGILLETYLTNELRIRVTPTTTTFDSSLIFPSASRNFTFQNASGTLAFTSDIPAVAGVYLPLAGGTLTGALSGTSATFSGLITSTITNNAVLTASTSTTNRKYIEILNDGGQFYAGIGGSTPATIFANQLAYSSTIGSANATALEFGTNATIRLSIASTGAATFSSSITAGGRYFATASVADNIVEVINTDTTNGYGLFVRAGGTAANRYVARFKNAADSDVMWIDKGGNVGIGTNNPIMQLHSSRAGGNGIFVSNTTNNVGGYIFAASYGFELQAVTATNSGPQNLFIQPYGGNVLIGTTTDAGYKLDVNGTGRFSNGFFNGFATNGTPSSTGTAQNFVQFRNTGSDFYIGQEGSTAGGFFTGSSAYASVFYSGTAQEFIIGGTRRLQIATSGAATFSSSVTATSFFESSSVAFKNILATNPVTSLNIDVIKYKRTNVDMDDVRYGYSAEQINSLMPELTNKEATAVKYLDVHTLLIAELQREIKELKAKLN
jgi:hypothetical protein